MSSALRARAVLPFASICLAACVSAAAGGCGGEPSTEQDLEAEAWGFRGRPSQIFLSEHGIGGRAESLTYYRSIVPEDPFAPELGPEQTFTVAKWKRMFFGEAPIKTAFYRNAMELGFWREMSCTSVVGRGVGGCMVTNWSSPEHKASGHGNDGTVAMTLSPEGYVRFYSFLPAGRLSASAELDREGPKFMPRLCTVCHSGAAPRPSEEPDLGSVFREFDPRRLEARPGVPREVAEREWRELNAVVREANLAIRTEAKGSPPGTDHAKSAIVERIDALYREGDDPDALPPSWQNAGPEAVALWSKIVVPYCMACHRHNAFDWTHYPSLAQFRHERALANYLPDPPNPNAPVFAMPQAAHTFELLRADQAARDATAAWLSGH